VLDGTARTPTRSGPESRLSIVDEAFVLHTTQRKGVINRYQSSLPNGGDYHVAAANGNRGIHCF
jgi:hypothetical protein